MRDTAASGRRSSGAGWETRHGPSSVIGDGAVRPVCTLWCRQLFQGFSSGVVFFFVVYFIGKAKPFVFQQSIYKASI